jgi:hypothetical protein
VAPARRGWGWSPGVAVELAAACGEGGDKLGGGGLQLALAIRKSNDSGLAGLVAAGEVGNGRFERADHFLQAGGLGRDVGVPALAGRGLPLRALGELAGGAPAVPAPLTVLSEPFDLSPLVLGSGQPADGVTNGCSGSGLGR